MNLGIAIITYIFINVCFCNPQEDALQELKTGVEKLITRAKTQETLKQTIRKLKVLNETSTFTDTVCKSCFITMNNIILYRRTGASKESMRTYLKRLCNTFTDWGPVACRGFIEIEIDTALFIIDNKSNLTPERICAIQYQQGKCPDPDAEPWDVPLPSVSAIDKTSSDKTIKGNDSRPYNILHITDIHYDQSYVPGSNAKCDKPLCCHGGTPDVPSEAAGFWGDYYICDMPWHSVEDLMHRIKENHKNIDFVYFTGDIISHTSWNTSKKLNTESIKKMFATFSESFGNTKVYPILGNHEPHPTDFFAPEDLSRTQISTQWVFDLVAEEWSRWLPTETKTTIQKGGFYTVLIKPGFRIVALNSNVCFVSNLWLIYNDVDPYDQLKWLVGVLREAEINQETVHILSHIPPGEISCHKQWSHVFKKIVNRFANTIAAHFNGHTHHDEFRLFYNTSNPRQPINVAFNGGSFTTYVGFNPNYRIYRVNADDLTVANYDQYIFDLEKANANATVPPKWFKLYSFREAYDLPDLKLDSLDNLIERMGKNSSLMEQYYNYMTRNSTFPGPCIGECLKKLLCTVTAVETNDAVNC